MYWTYNILCLRTFSLCSLVNGTMLLYLQLTDENRFTPEVKEDPLAETTQHPGVEEDINVVGLPISFTDAVARAHLRFVLALWAGQIEVEAVFVVQEANPLQGLLVENQP